VRLRRLPRIRRRWLRNLPPGILPPLILSYNASTVPILQLALTSKTLPEQELYDYGNNFIRTQLATVQGAAVPLPFGGKVRQIMVDIDSRGAAGARPVAAGCGQCRQRTEPHPAGRHRKDRRAGIQRQPERAARRRSRPSTICP